MTVFKDVYFDYKEIMVYKKGNKTVINLDDKFDAKEIEISKEDTFKLIKELESILEGEE